MLLSYCENDTFSNFRNCLFLMLLTMLRNMLVFNTFSHVKNIFFCFLIFWNKIMTQDCFCMFWFTNYLEMKIHCTLLKVLFLVHCSHNPDLLEIVELNGVFPDFHENFLKGHLTAVNSLQYQSWLHSGAFQGVVIFQLKLSVY